MPPSTSSALALAGRLRSLDDAALGDLLHARAVHPTGLKDFFDLAERLLTRESIQAALTPLDRPTLLSLVSGSSTDSIRHLLLTDEDDAPYDAVTATLAAWPALGLPSAAELALPAPAALEAVSTTDARFTDHAAGDRAYGATTAALELVAELEKAPARELVRGGLALPDAKRIAAACGLSLDEVPALLELCSAAGLAVLVGGEWLPGEAATAWRSGSAVERWAQLAGGWFAGLPGDIRGLLSERAHSIWGDHLGDYVRWLYPASADLMRERMGARVTTAELLGIVASGAPSTPGSFLIAGSAGEAETAMAQLFPAEVDRAYLQHDLTIVSPGPLQAPLDARLRELADVESSGLATTYRVSAGSLDRALAAGQTGVTLRAFLSGISLTGIPQPLDYLIDETERRHGLVRVSVEGLGSRVRSVDADLLATIAVDHRLAPIGLRRDGDDLGSRFDQELVFWALSDARYPVVAVDAADRILTLDRRRPLPSVVAPTDPLPALIERLRATVREDGASGWLERQLETAIKARTAVLVTVTLPTGAVEMVLEPTGLGGGRLRARDRLADIERTLPLSSISAVSPAE